MRRWLAGRSLARGLPVPMPDSGGWRVDTGSEAERRRYVFAHAGAGFDALARTIHEPRVFMKLCANAATLRARLPEHWQVEPSNSMMVRDGDAPSLTLPAGYAIRRHTDAAVTRVEIAASDGVPAASGHAVEVEGAFVYDRIAVEPTHRRRGLGRALMAALAEARRVPTSREVLTATPMGQALYLTLGWRVYTPYTTAVVPDAR